MKVKVWTTHGAKWRECIWKRRGLAIHRAVEGSGWTLTHVPSGLGLGYHFREVGDLALMPLIRTACFLTTVMDWREIEENTEHISFVAQLMPVARDMYDAWNAIIGEQIRRVRQ